MKSRLGVSVPGVAVEAIFFKDTDSSNWVSRSEFVINYFKIGTLKNLNKLRE